MTGRFSAVFTGVHQFCRIGAHVMTAVSTVILQDVPPYLMAAGNTATPYGINVEGLKRRGFTADAITGLEARLSHAVQVRPAA